MKLTFKIILLCETSMNTTYKLKNMEEDPNCDIVEVVCSNCHCKFGVPLEHYIQTEDNTEDIPEYLCQDCNPCPY